MSGMQRDTGRWKKIDEQRVDFLAMSFMHLFAVESGRVRSGQQPVTISNLSSGEVRLRLFQIASLPPRSATACMLLRNGCFDLAMWHFYRSFLYTLLSRGFFLVAPCSYRFHLLKLRLLRRDFRQCLIEYGLVGSIYLSDCV